MTAPSKDYRSLDNLDPQVDAFMKQFEGLDTPLLNTLTATQAREAFDNALLEWTGAPEEVAAVQNMTIPGPAGPMPIRVYTPFGDGPFPLLVYYHGGGWVIGTLDEYDNLCRSLANGASCVVVSVDYRLAPEHKFPAAAEDAYAAVQWAADQAGRIKVDPTRIAVAGDSAGGNLAAVTALLARDRGGPSLSCQVLIYPVCDVSSFEAESQRRYSIEGVLSREEMIWFKDLYCRTEKDASDPYVSPLLAPELSGLPPALVITAEFDVLRDEGEAYADRLVQAGVKTELVRYQGQVHGFLPLVGAYDQAREAIDKSARVLKEALAE